MLVNIEVLTNIGITVDVLELHYQNSWKLWRTVSKKQGNLEGHVLYIWVWLIFEHLLLQYCIRGNFSKITLHPIPSKFPNIWGEFSSTFLFCNYMVSIGTLELFQLQYIALVLCSGRLGATMCTLSNPRRHLTGNDVLLYFIRGRYPILRNFTELHIR
jgi:hypothetical protein